MGAFVGAVGAGAHAIETDIHLSKDDVVVLSHVSRVPVGFLAFWECLRNFVLCRMPHSNDASEWKIS
jgi:glycerophosphoryl diester phosphodiesterase